MHNHQLNLPPVEVTPVNRVAVKQVNPLRWVRTALTRCDLSQRWLAAAMGISEPLVSAQLSDHEPTKHLSLRHLGKVDEVGFWREFCLLALEDLGFTVVICTPEEKAALAGVQVACAHYARVSQR